MKRIRRLGSPMRRPRRRDQEEERIPRTRTSAGTTEPVVRHKIKQGRCPSPRPNPHPGTILLQTKQKEMQEYHSQSEPLVFRAFGLGGGVCKYEQAKRYTDKPRGTFFCFLAISFFSFLLSFSVSLPLHLFPSASGCSTVPNTGTGRAPEGQAFFCKGEPTPAWSPY